MRRPVFAANWKMHHGPQETRAVLTRFLAEFPPAVDRTVIFFPPTISLTIAGFSLRERPEILVGVQSIHWESAGAFTGETSPVMARDGGARVALVGHSERRHIFGETDEMTARKCAGAWRAGLQPLLCVGEQLAERERGVTLDVVMRQLRAGFGQLSASDIARSAVAYEPVWAIGTGRTATPDDASAVQGAIRAALREMAGDEASQIPILYGGSVNPENAASLLAAPDVDGLLVGGASLDPEKWARIART